MITRPREQVTRLTPIFLGLILGLILGLFLASPVHPFNTQFLDDAPISRFNSKDIDIMLNTITDALENAEDGTEVEWENSKTGNHGTVTPLSRKNRDGMDCRELEIHNFAGSFTGRARHLMCKIGDEWKAVTE